MALVLTRTVNVGGSDINEVFVIDPLLYPSLIPQVSGTALNSALSNTEFFVSFKRTVPDDTYIASAMIKTFAFFNWTLVAAVFSDDQLGSSGLASFTEAAEKDQNLKVTCRSIIRAGTVSGLSAFSTCISTSFSNVVVLWMSIADAKRSVQFISSSASQDGLIYITPFLWLSDVSSSLSSLLIGSLGFVPNPGTFQFASSCRRKAMPLFSSQKFESSPHVLPFTLVEISVTF